MLTTRYDKDGTMLRKEDFELHRRIDMYGCGACDVLEQDAGDIISFRVLGMAELCLAMTNILENIIILRRLLPLITCM